MILCMKFNIVEVKKKENNKKQAYIKLYQII